MTVVDERLLAVLERLAKWPQAEVYHKTGRSRSVRYSPRGIVTAFHHEEGWAVRAGDARRSFFYSATGAPSADAPWPEADGLGLRLPPAQLVPRWTPPGELDAPLAGENEAQAFFAGLERELDKELPGARLALGELDEGSSESDLVSSHEVAAHVRQRTAGLYLEASGPHKDAARSQRVTLRLAEREARRFQPLALARRLADRLLIAGEGTAPQRDRGEFLLAPPVAVSLLEALIDLWVGPDAARLTAPLIDRRGRIGSPALTLVDDGRLAGGVLAAPVDGEGMPTREVVLVEEGHFRQPLLAWWQASPGVGASGASAGRASAGRASAGRASAGRASAGRASSGCSSRPGWRDLPWPGPTHLYLRGDPQVRVSSLLENLSRGYYLLAAEAAPRVEEGFGRFAVPVSGFAIDSGRPTGPIARTWLVGTVSGLLNGIVAASRDLTFLPSRSGLVGSPSLLVRGLELRQRFEKTS